MKAAVVLVSLAQNQSRFFAALEPFLEKAGHSVVHVCFHEGSANELRNTGHRVFNPFELSHIGDLPPFEAYDIENPALLIAHEKAAYEVSDTQALVLKFRGHLAAMGTVLEKLEGEGQKIAMVQELGGFTSVLAAYYAAQARGIANFFIEPSFFKGRFFMTLNSLNSPLIPTLAAEASASVLCALDKIRVNQTVVIPIKDRSHYRGAFQKIADLRNVRRLFEKLYDKHVLKRQEEFKHIGGHVSRHLRMLYNSLRLRRHYTDIPDGPPLIYYPLHVPADFALTIRSPEYLDQPSLIDYLCRIAPLGYKVVIKEHPALVGSLSAAELDNLMARHDNLVLLKPTINNHRVLKQAEYVITVNSKAGAEALLYGKRVIALGDSFYRASGLVTSVDALSDLRNVLKRACAPDEKAVEAYFEDVWHASWPGELYDLTQENIATFAESIVASLTLWSQNKIDDHEY